MNLLQNLIVVIVGGIVTSGIIGVFTWWVFVIKMGSKMDNIIFRLTGVEADTTTIKIKQEEYLERIHTLENNIVALKTNRRVQ